LQGRHADGRGLYLYVQGGSRIWVYRYTDGTKKRREMSLGPVETMTLKEARDRRDELAVERRKGSDPMARASKNRSLAAVFEETYEKKKLELRSRWRPPVDLYILPKLGGRDVTKLTAMEIRDVLAPVWHEKPAIARKALLRLGITLEHAQASFPGEVDPHLTRSAGVLLGKQRHKPVNIPAMPWEEVPAFYASLTDTITSKALQLLVLTASRTTPIRLAHEDQFDGDTWLIPAENMKGGQEFRIPLSDEAQRVVELARPLARDGFLICAHKGKPLGQMTMNRLMAKREINYRPHGFRSSFRTWAEEQAKDWTLAEVSLDHSVGNKVQRSYQRSDLLEQRRPLMAEWANHVAGNQD